jgi:hypothetical protein
MTPKDMELQVVKMFPGTEISYKVSPEWQELASSLPIILDDKLDEEWGWEYRKSVADLVRQTYENIDPVTRSAKKISG